MDSTNRRVFCAAATASVVAGLVSTKAHAAESRTIKLDAQPTVISFDASRTVVVVVDMQNDFASKGGMFDRAGMDVGPIRSVVAPTSRVLASARRAGIPVFFLKMGFKPDLSDLGAPDSVNRALHLATGVGEPMVAPDGRPGRILVRDTWNTEVIPELAPRPDETSIYKSRFSGFHETDLHERLKAIRARHLVFTGCTTSVCVESTVRDAMFHDYIPILMADCMNEVVGSRLARTNHEATLALVAERFGWVSNSERLVAALG